MTFSCPGAKSSETMKRIKPSQVDQLLLSLTLDPPNSDSSVVQESLETPEIASEMPRQTNEALNTADHEVEEDEGEEKEDSSPGFSRAIAEYAHVYLRTLPLPRIYDGKPVIGERDWMRKNNIHSRIFSFPDPLLLDPKDPIFGKYRFEVVSWISATARLEVLDYESFYWNMLPEEGLQCHCGRKLHRKGMSPNVKLLKSLVGVDFTILAFVLYECAKYDIFSVLESLY